VPQSVWERRDAGRDGVVEAWWVGRRGVRVRISEVVMGRFGPYKARI